MCHNPVNPMNEKTLFLSLSALTGLCSCSMEPCVSRTFSMPLYTCSSCAQSAQHRGTATHLGSPAEHAAVCPAAADNDVVYRVKPGT